MNITNYTPHEVVLHGKKATYKFKSKGVARVKTEEYFEKNIKVVGESFDIYSLSYGEVEGLPEEADNDNLYIVSSMVLGASDRKDLIVPNDMIRDGEGRIIGCRSFKIK